MTMSCTRKRQPSLIRRRSLLKRKKDPRCNFPNKYVSTERRNRAFIYTVVHMQTERARAAGGLSRRVESLVSTAGGIERGGLPCSPANLAGLGKMKNRTDERRGTQRGHSQNMKKKSAALKLYVDYRSYPSHQIHVPCWIASSDRAGHAAPAEGLSDEQARNTALPKQQHS